MERKKQINNNMEARNLVERLIRSNEIKDEIDESMRIIFTVGQLIPSAKRTLKMLDDLGDGKVGGMAHNMLVNSYLSILIREVEEHSQFCGCRGEEVLQSLGEFLYIDKDESSCCILLDKAKETVRTFVSEADKVLDEENELMKDLSRENRELVEKEGGEIITLLDLVKTPGVTEDELFKVIQSTRPEFVRADALDLAVYISQNLAKK